jgi:tRNA(fMet)-specific endonuclease VapC
MGLILDSSVLISAERKGQNARQVLTELVHSFQSSELAISVITLTELAHGLARADSSERKRARMRFIQELATALPIHSVTESIAIRAGEIDGENQARGIRVPLADLLIGSNCTRARTCRCDEQSSPLSIDSRSDCCRGLTHSRLTRHGCECKA